MALSNPKPIIVFFMKKWGVNMRDLTGRYRQRQVVCARVEIARSLWNSEYSTVRIARLLQRDHSTVVYYLGLGKRRINNYKGVTIMAKPKLTNVQRLDLLRAQQEGGYQKSRHLALEMGVSQNYGLILADRAALKIGQRKALKMGARKARKISENEGKKWERAQAVGPINVGGSE